MSKHQTEDKPELHNTKNESTNEVEQTPEEKLEKEENDECVEKKAESEARISVLAVKLEQLESENKDLKDQYLRKLADYENFRKRMFREREESSLYANSSLLADLVDVIDNFDRAVQSADDSQDFKILHDGVIMIRQSLLTLLESKYGLKRFDSKGMEFDPNIHEAMLSEQGEVEVPTVVEELMKGYKLHERVIRPAKVKVCLPSNEASDSNN